MSIERAKADLLTIAFLEVLRDNGRITRAQEDEFLRVYIERWLGEDEFVRADGSRFVVN